MVKRVLIVMPVILLPHWQTELGRWCSNIRAVVYHGATPKARARLLGTYHPFRFQCALYAMPSSLIDDDGGMLTDSIASKGGICLTTYTMLAKNAKRLAVGANDQPAKWDYCILDV
jgi:SNF2 family DNA or RNA helicase